MEGLRPGRIGAGGVLMDLELRLEQFQRLYPSMINEIIYEGIGWVFVKKLLWSGQLSDSFPTTRLNCEDSKLAVGI